MKLLIDGSLNYLELLLIDVNNKIVSTFFIMQNKNLTDILVDSVDQFLQKNMITKNMISELLIINGPGSFTSIKLVSIFANTWKQFFPAVVLKQLNTCLWNSAPKKTINILNAKSNFYYVNINFDLTSENKKHIVNLISKDKLKLSLYSEKLLVNFIKDIQNPIFKWEFNKDNFINVDRIIPNYVKPAV
ncbi:hypothetical protein [Malacoplasma iowae]|uniref:hypothetical protein n=1 Tax=Malacoplasma iowae TaxID=2116 RepID=UPI002A18B7F2|nr:hypothetical protein [Malacoplasma iowae]WPL37775.1 hypothetical protein QX182_04710 [Malacoplasma iowae]